MPDFDMTVMVELNTLYQGKLKIHSGGIFKYKFIDEGKVRFEKQAYRGALGMFRKKGSNFQRLTTWKIFKLPENNFF